MNEQFVDYDPQLGIKTTVHLLDGKTVYQKTYDAEPFLKAAAEARAASQGQSWGNGRIVGSVPMADLATMMRQDGTIDPKRAAAWLKARPELVHFEKFLRT